jgi:hypothetical protein
MLLEIWTLEDKAILLSRNVGTRLHFDTASYSGRNEFMKTVRKKLVMDDRSGESEEEDEKEE